MTTATAEPDPTLFPDPSEEQMGYVAWRRVRTGRSAGKWEPVAHGRTEREASDKLFALMAGTTGHSDSLVLPSGDSP